MPDYGQVGFTLIDIKIAPYNLDGTYGTAVSLQYGQKLGFKPVATNDMLTAYGMGVELLSVVTHGEGTLTQGLIDLPAYAVLIGGTSTESGSTPNRERTLDYTVGGQGLPYFGLIGKLAGVNNSDLHLGFRKCMLDSIPGFDMEQNKFILPETGMKMITPDVATRKLLRLRTHETAAAVPTVFTSFFAA